MRWLESYIVCTDSCNSLAATMAVAAPGAPALSDKIEKIVPQLRGIIKLCSKNRCGIMQPSVDQIVRMCLDEDVAVKRNILPRNTGIHPESRSKTGLDPLNAQDMTLRITIQGFSETKLERPMGFEKALEGALHEEQKEFNEKHSRRPAAILRRFPSVTLNTCR